MAYEGVGPATVQEFLPQLEIDGPREQPRLTVLFRWLMIIPHIIVLFFIAIAAFFAVIAGWFAALVTGRLPEGIAGFLSGYLAWSTRVGAYMELMVAQYPPFAFEAPEYPVRIELRPGELNRAAVFFRLILGLPAIILSNFVSTGWFLLAFGFWVAVLITGRTPVPVFGVTAAQLRYSLRVNVYMMLLTSAYPKRLFGDQSGPQPAEGEAAGFGALAAGQPSRGTRPLVLSPGARALLVISIVLGVLANVPWGGRTQPQPQYPYPPYPYSTEGF